MDEDEESDPASVFQAAVSKLVIELEELIDQHVHDLFDLNDERIGTIEDFLTTFSVLKAEFKD